MDRRLSQEELSILLLNETWQPVPGIKNTRIFPILRKPDTTCSNVFIINIGGYQVLIDTGAKQEMMDKVCDVLNSEPSSHNKPIIIIFGHAHFDHIYQGIVDRRINSNGRPVYLCHTSAGDHLLEGDGAYSQANLVDLPIPSFRIDLRIFSEIKEQEKISEQILPGISYSSQNFTISDRVPLISEQMIFPDGQSLVFWDVPGHSPDSMAIQAGNLIHVGDIPYATNPGVAGIIGYDPQELYQTVIRIRWILQNQQISIICPGHGDAINPEGMKKFLDKIERDLKTGPEIGIFDRDRVEISMLHAIDIMDEAHRILPILFGRIMVLRYYLEELEEYDTAQKLGEIIRDDDIDKLLSQFNIFYDDFKAGIKRDIEIVLKTLQTLKKIRNFIPKRDLESIIDPSLLRRIENLFSDFLCTINGVMPASTIVECNLATLLKELKEKQIFSRISDDELVKSGDNEETFKKALLYRLSEYQNKSDISIQIKIPAHPVLVQTDPERLYDFLSAIVEYFDIYGAESVDFLVLREDRKTLLYITPDSGFHPNLPISPALLRTIRYSGGEIKKMPSREEDTMILEFHSEPI